MADKRFMQLLEDLKREYKPQPLGFGGINADYLLLLEHYFQDVGSELQKPDVDMVRSSTLLWLIAMRALDGIQVTSYEQLFKDIEDLHCRKNSGYAGIGATDHWANFRMATWFGVTPLVGCLVRMTDKFIRIRNLTKNPAADQVNENIKDTLFDMAIYALIAICLLEEGQVQYAA